MINSLTLNSNVKVALKQAAFRLLNFRAKAITRTTAVVVDYHLA
jgi:hypothetical protein